MSLPNTVTFKLLSRFPSQQLSAPHFFTILQILPVATYMCCFVVYIHFFCKFLMAVRDYYYRKCYPENRLVFVFMSILAHLTLMKLGKNCWMDFNITWWED